MYLSSLIILSAFWINKESGKLLLPSVVQSGNQKSCVCVRVRVCVCSYTYSVEFASIVSSTYCHDSSVTCIAWKENILATGSWDSTVKVCACIGCSYVGSDLLTVQVWKLAFPTSGGTVNEPRLLVS